MSDPLAAEDPRQSQIRDIVSKFFEQCTRGESPDPEEVESRHPELMPELADELRKLRLVALARRDFQRVFEDGSEATHDYGRESVETATISVRCPHCTNSVEILVDLPWTDITCVACGSVFSLVADQMATRDAPSLKRIGHFELIERIGVGGFGTVWKARDTMLDRVVALKLPRRGQLTEDEIEKFLREARAAAQLRHPNIVSVHEVGRCDDTVYIVSDLVRGISLTDWMAVRSPLPREAAQICTKIARALDHAHQAGIVHRDLKPGNIMVDAVEQPHIMDFGLAKREAGEVTMTIEGQVLGTPAYMAPEQARGQAHLCSPRTDVYSLGVVLFELLTGELPFRGNTNMLLHQVLNDEPPSPRKLNNLVPIDLETICLKCLEKDPLRRFESAGALADELDRVLEQRPIQSRPVGAFERAVRWCLRHQTTAGLLTAVVVTLVVGTSISTYFAMLAAGFRGQAEQSERKIQQQTRSFTTETSSFFEIGSAQLRSPFNRQMQTASPLWSEQPDASLALLEDEVRCPKTIRDFTWKFFHRNARRPDQVVHASSDLPLDLRFGSEAGSFAIIDRSGTWRRFQQSPRGRWNCIQQRRLTWNEVQAACLRPRDLAVIYQEQSQLLALDPLTDQKSPLPELASLSTHQVTALVTHDQEPFFACWLQPRPGHAPAQLAILDQEQAQWHVVDVNENAQQAIPRILANVSHLQFSDDNLNEIRIGDRQGVWLFCDWRAKTWRVAAENGSPLAWPVGPLASGDACEWGDGQVRWTAADRRQIASPVAKWQSAPGRSALAPDRATLALATQQGTLTFWSTPSGRPHVWKDEIGQVRRMALAHDVPLLAVATATELRILSYETGQDTMAPITLDQDVEEIVWSKNDEGLAFRYVDGTVRYLTLSSVHQVQDVGSGQSYTSVLFRDNDRLLLGTDDGQLIEWRSMRSATVSAPLSFAGPIHALASCQDKGAIFVAHGRQVDIVREGQPTIKLPEHTGDVTHLSVSRMGDCILCCTREGVITRWRINWTNGQFRPLEMDTRSTGVTKADISPDGETIATIQGSTILLWDGRSCEFRGTIETGDELISARFASLPKLATNQLFSCDQQGSLKSWQGHSVTGRNLVYTGGVIRAWAAVHDPPLMLGAGDGPTIVGVPVAQLDQPQRIWHGQAATSLSAASGDLVRVAVGFWNGDLRVYQRQGKETNWRELASWRLPSSCRQLALSSDANLLVGLLVDGSLVGWNLASRAPIALPTSDRPITCLAWSRDGQSLAWGTASGELHSFHLTSLATSTPKTTQTLTAHQGAVIDLKPLANGNWASIGTDERLAIHDPGLTALLTEARQSHPICLAAHPTDLEVAIGSETEIHRWALKADKLRRIGQPWSEHVGFVASLAYAADGRTLFSSSEDRSTIVWELVSNLPPLPTRGAGAIPENKEGKTPDSGAAPTSNAPDPKDVIPADVRALFESTKKP